MQKVTYDQMIIAVQTGAYKVMKDDELRDLVGGALDIHGSNPRTMAQIHHAAESIRIEIAERESAKQHHQTQRVAWIAAWVGVASIAATVLAYILQS